MLFELQLRWAHAAIAFFVGAPVLCVLLPLHWAMRQNWPKLRQAVFFPLAGTTRIDHAAQRMRLLRALRATEVTLTTADERTVHGIWAEPYGSLNSSGQSACRMDANNGVSGAGFGGGGAGGVGSCAGGGGGGDEGPPVVILLHANAMVLDDMSDWAQFYLSRGLSVLAITFAGYPDPAEDHKMDAAAAGADESFPLAAAPEPDGRYCPTELSLYLDAEAALEHVRTVRRIPVKRILAHGLSVGGAAALALGVSHAGLQVTVDQTFASMREVSQHVGKSLYAELVLQRAPQWSRSLLHCLAPCLVRLAVWVLLRMAFKLESESASRFGCCAPDRLDNVAKAARLSGDLFVLFAEHDQMMPHSFASKLFHARYGSQAPAEKRLAHMLRVPGSHCSFFGDVPALCARYEKYLRQQGLLR